MRRYLAVSIPISISMHTGFHTLPTSNNTVHSSAIVAGSNCNIASAPVQEQLASLQELLAPLRKLCASLQELLAPLRKLLAPLHNLLAPLQKQFADVQELLAAMQKQLADVQKQRAPGTKQCAPLLKEVKQSINKVNINTKPACKQRNR